MKTLRITMKATRDGIYPVVNDEVPGLEIRYDDTVVELELGEHIDIHRRVGETLSFYAPQGQPCIMEYTDEHGTKTNSTTTWLASMYKKAGVRIENPS